MSATYIQPEIQVLCYPLSAVRKAVKRGLAIADELARMYAPTQQSKPLKRDGEVERSPGDAHGDQAVLRDIENLQWLDLGDGTAGFTLQPTVVLLNNILATETDPPAGAPSLDSMQWATRIGVHWRTVVPDRASFGLRTSFLKQYASSGAFIADTTTTLARNRAFIAQLILYPEHAPAGRAASAGRAYVRIAWSNEAWSIRFEPDNSPTLERRRNREWKVVGRFDGFSGAWSSSDIIDISVAPVAGRLMITITGAGGSDTVTFTDRTPDRELKTVNTAAGKVRLEGENTKCDLALHVVKWGSSGEEDGSFRREFRARRGPQPWTSAATAQAFGHIPPGATADVAVSDTATLNIKQYSVTCRATPGGIETPLLTRIGVRLPSATVQSSASPIDIRPAVLTADEQWDGPPRANGSEWTLRVDRNLLHKALTVGGTEIGSAWTNYLGDLYPIRVKTAWRYRSGGTPTTGSWYTQLVGYQSHRWSHARFADGTMTITCLNEETRLQGSAGIIDGRFAPLDLLWAEFMTGITDRASTYAGMTVVPSAAKRRGDGLMGWEMVYHILAVVLGEDVANELRVYVDDYHYSMLTRQILLEPRVGKGFFWMPPWGKSAHDWIATIATKDNCVFCWFGDTPVYGHYYNIVAAGNHVDLYDSDLLPGYSTDRDVIERYEAGFVPDKSFNRYLVWGNALGYNKPHSLPFPATIMAEAQEPTDVADTWERTLLVHDPSIFTQYMAEGIAVGLADQFRDKQYDRRPPLHCRGLPELRWGDLVTPHVTDDGAVISGKSYRVVRKTSHIDMGKGIYTSSVVTAPYNEVTGK